MCESENECGVVIPQQESITGCEPKYVTLACTRRDGHKGFHSFVTPDGREFTWRFIENCDSCTFPDECECIEYHETQVGHARKRKPNK